MSELRRWSRSVGGGGGIAIVDVDAVFEEKRLFVPSDSFFFLLLHPLANSRTCSYDFVFVLEKFPLLILVR